ncbi:MAG TPA: cytochrome ubiquinol oxidase subunit I [Candidatus Acidoferrum sp.]|nr:cytochrome ubiquinol oxidase subunit I [Candidatus Acidoferrum sp.]
MIRAAIRNARRRPLALFLFGTTLAALAAIVWAGAAHAAPAGAGAPVEYRQVFDPDSWLGRLLNPRVIVWIFAQMHLNFAAFVLAVPMFAYMIEVVGALSKDAEKARRYDALAHEFTRLLAVAFSITAILGAVLTFLLIVLYPKMMNYMVDVFGATMYLYALVFFFESFSLYLYYYGWGRIARRAHLALGLSLNIWGVVLLLITNAWVGFMMSPPKAFQTEGMIPTVKDHVEAFTNYLWMPINIHRLIANLCLGGSVVGAYAAFKFLTARTGEERAHYDWMGFIGNFVAILALMPLPFAGYYLALEVYKYDQGMGVTMMGGIFSWLFIVQAVLIASLFLGMNHYLWLGMDRIEGSERYRGWIKWMLAVITVCGAIWATPHSLIATASEVEAMGGQAHPAISKFGVMSAKNTAVNFIILTTLLSFVLYRRGNKVPTVKWAPAGKLAQAAIFGIVAGIVLAIGVYGYFIPTEARVALSPWQAISVGTAIVLVIGIDIPLMAGAREIGQIRWGQVSRLSQYMLIFVAVSFTWLMGLMGFVRSGLRLHWHINYVVRDTSPDAFTPTLGFATTVISCVVLLFFAFVAFVFWISGFSSHGEDADEPAKDDTASAIRPEVIVS